MDNPIIIYDKLEMDFTHYGLGVIRQAVDPGPRVYQKLNAEYTCEFTVPFTDPAAKYLVEENIIKLNGQLFIIRTVNERRDSKGRLLSEVFAEHITTELLTEYIPLLQYTNATAAAIVNGVLAGTRFTGDASAVTSSHDFTVERKSATWGLNHFLELSDAEMKPDNFHITFKPQIGADNGVRVNYRKNLQSITRTKDSQGVITRLYVYGKDGLTIPPIDSPHIGDYPRPKAGEVTFDDVEDAVLLKAKGEAYLATVDVPLLSYDASVTELKAVPGWGESEAFSLGDTVHVDDEDLGIAVAARIVEYEEYPWSPSKSRVTLSNFRPDLADVLTRVKETSNTVDRITAGGSGRVSTYWLDGKINALKNQIIASGAYASAEVLPNEGFLLENTDVSSPGYGALYLGPGIFAIAKEKSGGDWVWRTFGTGQGFSADEINVGTLNAGMIRIGSGTVFDPGYDPSTKETPAGAQAKAAAAEQAAKDAAVLKGTKYSSVYMDANGFHIDSTAGEVVRMGEYESGKYGVVGYHVDGSKTILSGEGLLRLKSGTAIPYHYLGTTGSAETGVQGGKFDGGGGRYTSGQANGAGIANVTIQLPDDYKGKNFFVALSVKSASSYAMATADGDDWYIPYADAGTYLEIVSIDYANATFTVKGYGKYFILDGSNGTGFIYWKYYAIQFSYVAVV